LKGHGDYRRILRPQKKQIPLQAGQKENPGGYKPVSHTSVLGKVMEQIIPETVSKTIKMI